MINNQTYLNNAIVYVHNNPVHHLICQHPIEYPWSSYTSFISNKPTKIKRKETLCFFDGKENLIQKHKEDNKYDNLITF